MECEDTSGMTDEESLQLVSSAWCAPATSGKVMDGALAEEFAKILRREVNAARVRMLGVVSGVIAAEKRRTGSVPVIALHIQDLLRGGTGWYLGDNDRISVRD